MANKTYFLFRNGERIWVNVYHNGPFQTTDCADSLLLVGMIFRCEHLSRFFYGGGQDLRQQEPPPDLSEIVIEVWSTENKKIYIFEETIRLYNVVAVKMTHEDCVCCCGGTVEITFEKMEVCEADKRQIEINDNDWFKPEYLNEKSICPVLAE